MKLEIQYTKKAYKAIDKKIITKKECNDLVIKAIKKIVKNEDINIDLKRLKGDLKNYYRIRYKKVRILFKIENKKIEIVAVIEDIDFRGNIY
ncbi:MAG: hypothetical protein GXO62_06695 [Epsilonproteobacteria bacterium]|nr:hypothetical protein [Campylobacterota bacterium]